MKLWLVFLGAALAGAVFGFGEKWLELAMITERFSVLQGTSAVPEELDQPPPELAPEAVVQGSTVFNFGTMARFGTLKHTFVIANEGNGPLELKRGATTCKCTVAGFGDGTSGDSSGAGKTVVAPGDKAEITLEWTATDPADHFEQSAEILTNDPTRPAIRFEVKGWIDDVISAYPGALQFDSVSSNRGHSSKFFIYSTRKEFEIEDYEMLEEDQKEFFELELKPATSDELAGFPGAKFGYRGTVTVKPGLPTGGIHQTIRLETNLPDVPQLDVPVSGSVVSDVSVLGDRRFLGGIRRLRLGPLRQSEGGEADLFILVKGENHQDVKVDVESVNPSDVLQARLGEPKVGDKTTTWPLKITVPPDTRLISRLGSADGQYGKIILTTTHPEQERLSVEVSFAINPD